MADANDESAGEVPALRAIHVLREGILGTDEELAQQVEALLAAGDGGPVVVMPDGTLARPDLSPIDGPSAL